MPAERTARAALRLIPAILALFELRFLFTAAAHGLAHGSAWLSGTALASPATWLLLALAAGAIFFLRETGRGLLAAVAAGGLIGAIGLLTHVHPFSDGFTAGTTVPLLAVAGVALVAAPTLVKLAVRYLARTRPPGQLVAPGELTTRLSAQLFIRTPAPLLAGASGRGPPAGYTL